MTRELCSERSRFFEAAWKCRIAPRTRLFIQISNSRAFAISHRRQNLRRRPEIQEPGQAARRDLLVEAPLLDIPVLIDMSGSPDLVLIERAAQQSQCQQRGAGHRRHNMECRDRPWIV